MKSLLTDKAFGDKVFCAGVDKGVYVCARQSTGNDSIVLTRLDSSKAGSPRA
jgi:hypothetical protein